MLKVVVHCCLTVVVVSITTINQEVNRHATTVIKRVISDVTVPITYQSSTNKCHKAKSVAAKPADTSSSDEAFISDSKQPEDRSYDASRWVIDSGATRHMTPCRELLVNYVELTHLLTAVGVGQIKVEMKLGKKAPRNSVLKNVLHVPGLACNLFSVRSAADSGKIVQFGHT